MSRRDRIVATAPGVVFLVAVGVGIVWFDWDLKTLIGWRALVDYINPNDATGRKDAVQVYALIVAGVVATITAAVGLLNLRLTRRNLEQQRELEALRAQGSALQAYYEQIGKLLTEYDLLNTEREEIRQLARGQTLTVLQGVNGKGKGSLLSFLYGAGLLVGAQPDVALTGADLRGADLEGADLEGANLQEAYLQQAHLRGVNLQGANLQGAYLRGAYLQGADLDGASLRKASLSEANLRGANLRGANLEGAYLRGAYLKEGYLPGAYLRGAYFQGAYLRGANLEGANLEGANLRGANLEGANLRGADLRQIISLTQEQIEWTIGSNGTKLEKRTDRSYEHPFLPPQDPPIRPGWWSKPFAKQVQIVREHIHGDS